MEIHGLQFAKKGKIIRDEETPSNELKRKLLSNKKFELNKELFWQDMIHSSNIGLRQLATDFIKRLKFRKLLF